VLPSDDDIPMPKRPLKLPIVLSPEEVVRFLACVASTKHRAIHRGAGSARWLPSRDDGRADLSTHSGRSVSWWGANTASAV
jgi:hypothetical protein